VSKHFDKQDSNRKLLPGFVSLLCKIYGPNPLDAPGIQEPHTAAKIHATSIPSTLNIETEPDSNMSFKKQVFLEERNRLTPSVCTRETHPSSAEKEQSCNLVIMPHIINT
jgi:hypothetical protein